MSARKVIADKVLELSAQIGCLSTKWAADTVTVLDTVAAALRDDREIPQVANAIPMLLWCPSCGERHVDTGAFVDKPHHTHACQKCGMVWRPAVQCTVGVQFLPGFKDSRCMCCDAPAMYPGPPSAEGHAGMLCARHRGWCPSILKVR